MPYNPYRRYRRYYRTQRRRRFRPFTWRLRRTIRRPRRRRYRVRRFLKFRKYKRKLKTVTIKQWQPNTIRNCSIKGHLPIILCGRGRIPHNWTIYSESIVPEEEPGGGAWSFTQLTLRALYDEHLKYRNWWTKGNDGLPLVKYRYTKLTFYRSKFTDYVVNIIRCPPFSVTKEDYLDTQPSRMLMNIHKILVPSMQRKQYKKTAIKKIIRPPALWTNKWYFQQDICNFPFFVIKASALSLDQFYQPSDQISNNITLMSLNTDFFQNPQWKTEATQKYSPKSSIDTTDENKLKPVYIWGSENGISLGSNGLPQTFNNLTLLANTVYYTEGNVYNSGTKSEYMTKKK